MKRLALPLVLALALTGCTKDRDRDPAPADATAQALAAVAKKASGLVFGATYQFTERASGRGGTLVIWQRPPDYRLDISVAGTTASYLATSTGVVSCTIKKGVAPDCFLVARPNEPVPELFDPGFQRLFKDAVDELAAAPQDYSVQSASPRPSDSQRPSAQCFAISRLRTPSPSPGASAPAGFETGEYCFADDGMPVRFDVKSGTIELVTLGAPPTDQDFTPPAPPKTLPPLPSATASPSRS